MKLHTGVLAITSAIVAAIAYVIGGILHFVSPWGAPALVSYIFHVDIVELAVPFTWDGFSSAWEFSVSSARYSEPFWGGCTTGS